LARGGEPLKTDQVDVPTIEVCSEASAFWVAEVLPIGGAPNTTDAHSGEGLANARLIAAAPEMYDALKVLTLTPHILKHLLKHDPQALAQAQDAIRKAEGGG
jgi:hypothetical protein